MFYSDDWYPGSMMDGNRGNDMMDGGAWVMMFFGLFVLVLAVAAIVWAVRSVGTQPTSTSQSAGPGSARDVLDLRLARGEVTPEEYSAARTLLGP